MLSSLFVLVANKSSSTAAETMLNSALVHYTTGQAPLSEFTVVAGYLASVDRQSLDAAHVFQQYEESRGFGLAHLALLDLNRHLEAPSYRLSAAIHGNQANIDAIDHTSRTTLTWAVEYRCIDAVTECLRLSASPNLNKDLPYSVRMPLLHLLLAGPANDPDTLLQILDALIVAGADVMSIDDDGWTPLHIAASWNMLCILLKLLEAEHCGELIATRTNLGETAFDLACSANGDHELLMLLK